MMGHCGHPVVRARGGERMTPIQSAACQLRALGTEAALTGRHYVPQNVAKRVKELWRSVYHIAEEDEMSTRAQIGIYEDTNLKTRPVAIIYRHSDGYPSGHGGVMPSLVQFVQEITEKRGGYDAEYVAAQLMYRFVENYDCGVSALGYGVGQALHGDTRFYYAVTPEGVSVFDARDLVSLVKLPKPMFVTPWPDSTKLKQVTEELQALSAQVVKKQLELQTLKAKQFRASI